MKHDQRVWLRRGIWLLILAMLVVFFLINRELFSASSEDVAGYVKALGWYGPLAFVLLIMLEVIIAPIPGSFIAIATGYAYGPLLGTIICYTGNILGTTMAFHLARHFGRNLVEKLIKKEKLALYDDFMQREGKLMFVFSFFLPILPPDIVSLIAGLSSIRFRTFIVFAAIGYLPYMLLLNYFGMRLFRYGWNQNTILLSIIVAVVMLLSLLSFYVLRRKKRHKENRKPRT